MKIEDRHSALIGVEYKRWQDVRKVRKYKVRKLTDAPKSPPVGTSAAAYMRGEL